MWSVSLAQFAANNSLHFIRFQDRPPLGILRRSLRVRLVTDPTGRRRQCAKL